MSIVSLFYDYVDINGVNIIKVWCDQLEPRLKAKFTSRIITLEQLNRPDWARNKWIEVLKGDKDGLIAIKVEYQRIQYRLLGYDGPYRGEFTLLSYGTERNNKYIPLEIGAISFRRKNEVNNNPVNRRVRHDYN